MLPVIDFLRIWEYINSFLNMTQVFVLEESFTPIRSVSWLSWLIEATWSCGKGGESAGEVPGVCGGQRAGAQGTLKACTCSWTCCPSILGPWVTALSALPSLCNFNIYWEHVKCPTFSFDRDFESLLSVSIHFITVVANNEQETEKDASV